MKDVGVTADKENLKHMIKALHGKSVPDHIRAGSAKMATMSAGAATAGKFPDPVSLFSSHRYCCSRKGCPRQGGEEARERARGGHGHGWPVRLSAMTIRDGLTLPGFLRPADPFQGPRSSVPICLIRQLFSA